MPAGARVASIGRAMATTEIAPTPAAEPATNWHTLAGDDVAQQLGVDTHAGLSDDEAAERLRTHGPNKFAEVATEPRWRAFLRQYEDLMQIVLVVAGVMSFVLGEAGTGLVILSLTLLNAVLGLQQEGKAAAAVAALQEMMIIKARVRRGGKLAQIPAEELVPGDVVAIEAGDVVPADGRVLVAATLEVAEAALTGESLPVAKGLDAVAEADTPLGDRDDMVFMNTNVTRGSGEFVVTATGMATEVGHISHLLQSSEETETPLTLQLKKLTKQILWIAGAALVVSMALNLSRDESFDTVFTAAVAFAIAAIPTGLPRS
jgi:Ca2+-transporting ATPase